MNFLADENIDRQIVDRLRTDGHLITYVAEMSPGISDEMVLAQANQAGDLLLTADKDFGELIYRQHRLSLGVILIRLAGIAPDRKAEIVAAAIKAHDKELSRAFAVITSRSVRIRRGILE